MEDTGTVEPDPLGDADGEELGEGAGRIWHWLLLAAATAACDPARAAAVAPVHTTATPASTAKTEDSARFPCLRIAGRDPSLGGDSRFSIIG